MKRQAGFTLLEVLVAVAVTGIALGALLSGFGRYADQAGYLRQKTLGTFVAHNRLNELLLQPGWPATGSKEDMMEMSGVEWRYRLVVRGTEDPELRRIDLKVFAPGVKDLREETPSVADLTAFLASTGRQ